MITTQSKTALILGHPGHELRVFRFLELYKPRVYILTDGSGRQNQSRVGRTLKILEQAGATASPVMGRFSEREIYDIMLKGDLQPLFDTMDEILADMTKYWIDTVVGESIEGFHPTHDLCRYMINVIVKRYQKEQQKPIPNYEFYVDGPPHVCPEGMEEISLWIRLSEEDFVRKNDACKNYPEIILDMEGLIKKHGAAPFHVECLWPVIDPDNYSTWKTPQPYYEIHGQGKVATGDFDEMIFYETHLLPLAKKLSNYTPQKL